MGRSTGNRDDAATGEKARKVKEFLAAYHNAPPEQKAKIKSAVGAQNRGAAANLGGAVQRRVEKKKDTYKSTANEANGSGPRFFRKLGDAVSPNNPSNQGGAERFKASQEKYAPKPKEPKKNNMGGTSKPEPKSNGRRGQGDQADYKKNLTESQRRKFDEEIRKGKTSYQAFKAAGGDW